MVKGNNADLSLPSAIRHVSNLRVDGSLDALDTGDVGHSFLRLADELIGTVAKLAHLGGKSRQIVSLKLVFSGNRLAHAHRTGDVAAEDH